MTGPHSNGELINGRYEIITYIGKGGMQFVYAAMDKDLNRKVALKTPQNNSGEKRFKRSAEVSAKVNHPNVAKTLDYFEYEDRKYLIEELIEGKDLDKAILEVVPFLDPCLAARIFHYLAKGLAASHHANVVHRDLKPTNIMVTGAFNFTTIKITDFGIAKMAGEELEEAVKDGEASISTSATAVGALPYMAPEAIDTPKEVGPPADIWSIGAMMFQLLTGEKPYGTGWRAAAKIMEAKPPEFPVFLTANPQYKPLANHLKDIILKCMQKEPSLRPTADELVKECGTLCYSLASRQIGVVDNILYNSFGFISASEQTFFFNLDSVYAEKVKKGDHVIFSIYPGAPYFRAHPVFKIQDSSVQTI